MRVILVLSALLALAISTQDNKEHAHNLRDLLHKVTEKYHGEHGVQRLRRRSTQEYKEIMKNFAKSVEMADKVNADASSTHSAEYNKISIMSDAERQNLLGLRNVSETMARERHRVERRSAELMRRERKEKRLEKRTVVNKRADDSTCSDGKQRSYRGMINVTKDGLECQSWDSQSPHKHSATPTKFPDAGLEGNYCRNPDGEPKAWCYTTDPDVRWQLCEVPYCPREHIPLAEDDITCSDEDQARYRGTLSVTKDGHECQRWDSHEHVATPAKYPNAGLEENYCRNPDSSLRAWCYTKDPNIKWQACEVPYCSCSDGDQRDYRGVINVTWYGVGDKCAPWDSSYDRDVTPANYPNAGLEGNYCRNPNGEERAWCYTPSPTDGRVRIDVNGRVVPPGNEWEYCYIGLCTDYADKQRHKYERKLREEAWKKRQQRIKDEEKARADEPVSVDWVARGALNPPEHQETCGSCWAFAAIAAVEANYYIMTGEKKSFAVQEYLDCSMCDGCGGGYFDAAYYYTTATGHMSLSSDVPYTSSAVACPRDGEEWSVYKCKWSGKPNGLTKARLTSHLHDNTRYVTHTDLYGDKGYQTALQSGVITVAMVVTGSFNIYRTGVWDCDAAVYHERSCNDNPNHGVAIVGYGVQSGIRYWNVRNSWGENWGDGGYIKMTRDGNGNVANMVRFIAKMPRFTCNEGETCTTPEWDESSHEDDDIDDSKGKDVRCGTITHSGGRCLSIDDSAKKWLELSNVCEREWCLTDQGYLYEKATDLCANIYSYNKPCEDKNTYYMSCNTFASMGYCKPTHTQYAWAYKNCAKTCGLCGANTERIRLQGKCTTKWTMSTSKWGKAAGVIKSKDDSRCMHPNGGQLDDESTVIIPDKACSAQFTFLPPKCWEVLQGKKLTGGNFGEVLEKNSELGIVIGFGQAKETCMELDDNSDGGKKDTYQGTCSGFNWVEAIQRYVLVVGEKIEDGAAGDNAYMLVSCDKACNAGEKRCDDGDCRANC